MHLTTVKIDKVFSVERRRGQYGRFTEFGFAAGANRHYSLIVPGWPGIEAGMEITAVLEKQGDWASLQGWLNHASREIAAPARGIWMFQLIAGCLMAAGVAAAWRDAAPLLLYAVYALPCGFMFYRADRVYKTLQTLNQAN